jgi:hypothetical protein
MALLKRWQRTQPLTKTNATADSLAVRYIADVRET